MKDGAARKVVHIVDDDEPVRTSLCALLSAHRYDAVASASAEEFLEVFTPARTSCAVIDLRLPGMNGIELQKLLVSRGVKTPLILLTAHGDVPAAVEAMKAGAFDFIEKPASEAGLLRAIEAATQASHPGQSTPHADASKRIAKLTSREKEVLEYLILGMTNKHIAEELGISQRTVEIHRSRIREKTEARGLADLIRLMR